MSAFFSHPDKYLKEHLTEVAENCRKVVGSDGICSDILSDAAYYIGLGHDFGKYTSFFQEHLINGIDNGKKSSHGFISAIFTAWLVNKHLGIKTRISPYKYLPLIAYMVVYHHHGDLNNLDEDLPSISSIRSLPDTSKIDIEWKKRFDVLIYHQFKDLLDKNRLKAICEEFRELGITGIESFFDEYVEVLELLANLRYYYLYKENYENKAETFIVSLLLFSALVDSDKRMAGGVSKVERKKLCPEIVDNYIKKEFTAGFETKINKLRNDIYRDVVNKIGSLDLTKHIFTMTAPTGSGKTLTSLSVALKLRSRIENEKGYVPRIIYSLPFISIIDQNYEVIESVLASEVIDFSSNHSAYIIKHHHLANLEYKVGDELKPLDESMLLVESWESEIVVTTFIQFLHTIIGFKNSFLKKYHNIKGSIILLDEVQNIPIEYWDVTAKVLEHMARYLGCYIILLTATRPLMFNRECSHIELVSKPEKYFNILGRVKICPRLENISIDELVEWVSNVYKRKESCLIVANTIRSSIDIFNKVREVICPEALFYLSTNIIPRERIERIMHIKEIMKNGGKCFVVSTQVVEAGIDLDFDVCFRDLGPIDSIVQVAGRCNREGNKRCGKVYVFSLGNFASKVYGKIHPLVSRNLLEKQSEYLESEFFKLVDEYFREVKVRINTDASKEIWESMLDLRYHHDTRRSVSDFQLIEEDKNEDIFVERDENAQNIWNYYCESIYLQNDYLQRLRSYLKIRKDFRSYIVSTSARDRVCLPPIVSGLRYVSKDQLLEWYNPCTGLAIPGDPMIW